MIDNRRVIIYNQLDQKKYGIDVAIFLQSFHEAFELPLWKKYEYEGDLWLSLSEEDIKSILPFWSQSHIDKVTRSVMKHKLMKKKRIYEISHGVCFAFVKKKSKE